MHFARSIRQAANAFLWLMMIASHANACTIFSRPDSRFWAEHATGIVDATVVSFEQRPLSGPGSSDESYQGPTTWVLTLHVHKTLRGHSSGTLLVATRFWNTTTVNEPFLRELLGDRREFALVGFYAEKSSVFAESTQQFEFPPEDNIMPPHDGFHVWDTDGEPLDEIWEGLCTSLPIFRLGTFKG